jgi:hypothetical protein
MVAGDPLDLFGTFLCCRFGIPELIRAGGGAVINTRFGGGIMRRRGT